LAAKGEISEISEKLKSLRRELNLCDGIAERSGVIQEKLEKVIAEEASLQRKEMRNHDKQR
jgi:hypothetical protein